MRRSVIHDYFWARRSNKAKAAVGSVGTSAPHEVPAVVKNNFQQLFIHSIGYEEGME